MHTNLTGALRFARANSPFTHRRVCACSLSETEILGQAVFIARVRRVGYPEYMSHTPKIVFLENSRIECILKKVRRSRSLRISVHQDGRVVVTAPYWESFKTMERFLASQREWLTKQLSSAAEMPRLVPYGNAEHYQSHREQARAFICETLERLNRRYGFTYSRVSIRNQQTRWGSCSSNGNLNFSYKLLFLPPAHAEYVVAHELCHLKELNHSPAFWRLVEQAIPDYRAIRRKLKHHIA